jgi:septum formation protein
MSDLILASGSAIRANVLRGAGLQFEVVKPFVDEDAVKAGLRAEGFKPRDQADALAEVKALSVSRRRGGYVIGADQMLALGEAVFDKPKDMAEAAENLSLLSGKTHHLICAAVIAKDGAVIWRHIETPALHMRALSAAQIGAYLDQAGEGVLSSVGAYQLEGLGSQLFERVEGDYFSILGVPLFALLRFLRGHGFGLA